MPLSLPSYWGGHPEVTGNLSKEACNKHQNQPSRVGEQRYFLICLDLPKNGNPPYATGIGKIKSVPVELTSCKPTNLLLAWQ
jgi:hypothetical protein